jgi:hypothetical protein
MLKRIPKSDINIRPFKAYKEWSFSGSAALAEPRIELVEANISSSDLSGLYPKNSIYGQLRAQFYSDSGDNPFTRTGHKTKSYTTAILSKERFLSGSAKVISIPQIYVGEGIKKGSVRLLDNQNLTTEALYIDDSYGNLQNNNDKIVISKIDVESSSIDFSDVAENIYSASLETYVGAFDIQSGTLDIIYNGQALPTIQLISLDIETGFAIAEDIPFLPEEAQGIKIGNVFYNQGLVVLTRDSAEKLQNEWQLDYKSTQTIYEHEYLLIVNQDEFNVSTNPSAVVNVGRETERYITTDGKTQMVVKNTGVNYIRKKSILENGTELDFRYTSSVNPNVFAGFEHYELSSSVDRAGSFLLPFITTIGLYDDDCQLVAVAKLPQPIKSESDIPVNFIIRFDT